MSKLTRILCISVIGAILFQPGNLKPTPVKSPTEYLVQLEDKVFLTVRDARVKLASAKERIDYVVEVAQSSLDRQVTQLQQLENLAKFEVDKTGVKINDCLKALHDSLSNLELKGVEQCDSSVAVARLNAELQTLIVLAQFTKEKMEKCLSSESERFCSESLNSDIRNKLTVFKKKLNSELGIIEGDSFSCVRGNLLLADSKLDLIGHKFKNCFIRKNEAKMGAYY
ncbi:uncharacterized protein LOC132705222 [Cylas formicarius]|uniref:uncharacterized protein LOC132705222 n=1 Tax=Cylas formicarius TaxID=197179 RepID=UPI002958BA71|nr:uncharacterized protein LOC132705222 [Cylas formicarius]